MVKFSERLNELMKENNTNAKTLADYLKLANTATIYKWRNGSCSLLLNTAIKLADFYQCNIDYLMGRTDDYINVPGRDCPPFGERLRNVLKDCNVSQYKILKNTNISASNLIKWLNNKSVPRMESVITLADYLDVSIDYLVGREP